MCQCCFFYMKIDDAKNHQVEDLVLVDGRSHGWSCFRCKPTRKPGKEV